MSKLNNITGNRYGKLQVVRQVLNIANKTSRGSYWECVCDCGNSQIYRGSLLTNGTYTQCSNCSKTQRAESTRLLLQKDEVGNTYHNLTALYRVTNSTKYVWKCNLCKKSDSDYNTVESEACFVKNGNTKSCGCLKSSEYLSDRAKEVYRERRIDLTGIRFGFLTAVSYVEHSYDCAAHSSKWLCKCDCGSDYVVKTSHLRLGEVTSCGCKTSHMLSLAKGGTGIPYEHMPISEFIRNHTPEYKKWRDSCLKRDDYTCQISKTRGGNLNVHHVQSLNLIINEYGITKDNYTDYSDVLFDINNGITLSEQVHQEFHNHYGLGDTTEDHFKDYLAKTQ